jgi:hypothetical protein
MKLYTSLSPNPSAASIQRACVKSWIDHGNEPICVQAHGDDVEASLPDGARAVRVKPTLGGIRHKPYVGLDAILDAFLATDDAQCGIINGDIEIRDPDGLIEAHQVGSLACLRRYDHDGDLSLAKVFPSGFDMFILSRQHALSVPRSMFVIGQTWWDYWLPWSCAQAGHRLTTINAPVIFHRRHHLNYAHLDWLRMTHHFCWLTGRSTNVQPTRVSGEIHAAINKAIAAP